MVSPPKKNHVTCITLLAELAENSVHNTGTSSSHRGSRSNYGRPRSSGRYSDTYGNGNTPLANLTSTVIGGVNGGDGREDLGTVGAGAGAGADEWVDVGGGMIGGMGGTVSKSPTYGFNGGKFKLGNICVMTSLTRLLRTENAYSNTSCARLPRPCSGTCPTRAFHR